MEKVVAGVVKSGRQPGIDLKRSGASGMNEKNNLQGYLSISSNPFLLSSLLSLFIALPLPCFSARSLAYLPYYSSTT